ncbi:TetR/AcrR family transcriptional regulator [Pedobacter sp. UBA5917]|jgi:AcrR family transcriptional regulator|uniref:TetR/AcrR family transcriptional regulator n=1 Tax=Pedobacter sp. UBA5917 TaxID=1947061 RepID=UPI0025DF4E8C|nr:TetR/AcrR family transcriptional regulator [Pedobacter sp. UBA5917]
MSKAADTRMMILQKSFELIYRKGYQATSIDEIIATTQVTKGAFYYHFKTKDDMGLSLINEVLYPGMYNIMIKPLEVGKHPAKDIYKVMENLLNDFVFFNPDYGCPAINLIEEMSPMNPTFKKALSRLVKQWQNAIVAALNKGKSDHIFTSTFVPEEVAMVVISGYGGVRNIGKALGKSSYKTYLKGLKTYLTNL